MFNYKKIVFELFRFAKIPNWMPEDIKNHPDILETPDTVNKDLLDLEPFRENIKINIKPDSTKITKFTQSIKDQLENIKYKTQLANILLNSNLDDLLLKNEFDKNIKTEDGQLNKGQKITKVYNDLSRKFNLKPLEQLNGFKEYSAQFARKEIDATIVFSTDPVDILTMSSRSGWTSCQNIFGDSILRGKAVATALMKNVGIIYITNQKDFSGRGEEMLYRSLVRVLRTEDFDDVIFIDKVYPDDNFDIKQLFLDTLSKHSENKVIDVNDFSDYQNLFIDPDNHQAKLSSPYYDYDELYKADEETGSQEVMDFIINNNYNKILNDENYAKWFLVELSTMPANYVKYNFDIINEISKNFQNNREIKTIITNMHKNLK